MLVAGCDVGSLTGKTVILKDDKVIGTSIVPTTILPGRTANNAMDRALENADGLERHEIEYIVGTGYGRVRIPFANKNVSEISCHGFGAWTTMNSVRMIVDIGGQDCKVIRIDDDGKLIDFVMNDKCAAGTGRFLEVMAKALEISLDELGPFSLKSNKPELITSQCSVFAETEVVSLVAEGRQLVNIIAGIHEAIASRVLSLINRVGLKHDITISGGVAKNIGVIAALEKRLKTKIKRLDDLIDPQLIGAYGAALFAKEELKKGLKPTVKTKKLKKWDF